MKALVFALLTMTGSVAFAQVQSVTAAGMTCQLIAPDLEYNIDLYFDYNIDSRDYTLASVGATGRGVTRESKNYLWTIEKTEIDLSRLAEDIKIIQPDGSYIEFSLLARMTGIVLRRGENGYFPDVAVPFTAVFKKAARDGADINLTTSSYKFNCRDADLPASMQ
jgi:hypothetical protein